MTHYFSLQIPAGIEKAMLRVECGWRAGDFHEAVPESRISRAEAVLVAELVAQAS